MNHEPTVDNFRDSDALIFNSPQWIGEDGGCSMNISDVVRIIVADDHPIFLKGLRSILDQVSYLRVIAEAHDGNEAWLEIQNQSPEVAILDLDMPELDGLQVARRVLRNHLPVGLIILTMHKNEDLFRQAIDLGVLGYLLKDDMAADIVRCIDVVRHGKHFIAPALSSCLVRASMNPALSLNAAGPKTDLSSTQREVLKLIAQGMTSKEIAAELGISYRTVENHRFRMVEKLGLKGSNSLLRFAMENKEGL